MSNTSPSHSPTQQQQQHSAYDSNNSRPSTDSIADDRPLLHSTDGSHSPPRHQRPEYTRFGSPSQPSPSSSSRSYLAHHLPRLHASTRHFTHHPLFPKTWQTLCICIGFFISLVVIRTIAVSSARPNVVMSTDETVGFSTGRAWKVIEELGKHPRGLNDFRNHAIYQYINQQLVNIQADAVKAGKEANSITIDANDTINIAVGTMYYQSTNLAVRVRGSKPSDRSALLVSSHYDSTPLSKGVTDDAVSVAAMIETLRVLAVSKTLEYDVIFLFNNGEEMGLLGGYAFLYHPWFNDTKAFINLEGTGAAGDSPPLLFRTNSPELTRAYSESAPHPHASVLVDDLMAIVRSDTDFRPFAGLGGVAGIDISFYTGRYLYHSPRDDIEHIKPISVQSMGDNLLALVQHLCVEDRLSSIPVRQRPERAPENLENGDFVYYDTLRTRVVITSGTVYKVGMILLLTAVVAGGAVRSGMEAKRLGIKRVIFRYVRPIAEAFLVVTLSFVVCMLVVVSLSQFKAWANRGSTYGLPGWNAFWILWAVLCVLCGMQMVWPRVAVALRIRKKPEVWYSVIPTSVAEFSEDDEEDLGGDDGLNYHRSNSGADHLGREGLFDDDDGDANHDYTSDTDILTAPPNRRRRASSILHHRPPRRRKSEHILSGPPLHIWLPYGILLFHEVLLFTAFVLATSRGLMGVYAFYDLAFYSALATAITVSIREMVRKWWREDVVYDDTIDPATLAHTSFGRRTAVALANLDLKRHCVTFYQQYGWLIWMSIAGTLPTLNILDILSIAVAGLPPLISEGLSESLVDAFFAIWITLLGLFVLPGLTRTGIHLRFLTILFAVLTFLCYIPSLVLFPFSQDRPHKLLFAETFNMGSRTSMVEVFVSSTMDAKKWGRGAKRHEDVVFDCVGSEKFDSRMGASGVCRFLELEPPDVDPGMSLNITSVDRKSGVVNGTFTGIPGAKVCTLGVEPFVEPIPGAAGLATRSANLSTTAFTNITVTFPSHDWKIIPLPPRKPSTPIPMFSTFVSRDESITATPFTLTYTPTEPPPLTLTCYLEARQYSNAYWLLAGLHPNTREPDFYDEVDPPAVERWATFVDGGVKSIPSGVVQPWVAAGLGRRAGGVGVHLEVDLKKIH
ncbi:hypothetical protein DFS34DRAFT_418427 [Phlyctochytrium arcticum]|nr:hypothetical protein DFS34DRAFT_418427 [Phlyctochytrium arcticum]